MIAFLPRRWNKERAPKIRGASQVLHRPRGGAVAAADLQALEALVQNAGETERRSPRARGTLRRHTDRELRECQEQSTTREDFHQGRRRGRL